MEVQCFEIEEKSEDHLWRISERNKKLSVLFKKKYGVSFERVQVDRQEFLRPKCSLKKFLYSRGLIGGWKDWVRFKVNNIM